jgi:periplasmic nitrate reductase NapE
MTHSTSNASARASAGTGAAASDPGAKKREILIFLLLAFFIWPFVAVAFVGGYGFIVWMYQMIAGPPGPPPV